MGIKISQLTEATSLGDTDYIVITRVDKNYKAKIKIIQDSYKEYTDNKTASLASITYVNNKCSTLTSTSYVDNKCSALASITYVDEKYDAIVELINSNKEVIANAITEMGVETSANDSFEVMAENIKKIGK